ncbi:hypothetical protein AB6N24_20565, partial [Cellulomonas sp. 179-A 4D5 NHS]
STVGFVSTATMSTISARPVSVFSTAAWVGGAAALVLAGVGGGVALVRRRSRLPFTLSMAVAAVCVALLVLAAPDLVPARLAT